MAIERPFYPGYYPGDPIIKGPPSGGSIIKPAEFNADVLREEIDELELMLPDVPAFVKKNIEDDLKIALRATFYGDHEKYTPTVELTGRQGAEEREDLPGSMNTIISLNPDDWKDPEKMIKKTVVGWGKAIFDWDDLDARNKRRMWQDLMTKDEAEWREKSTVEAIQHNIKRQSRGISGGVTPNPLKLKGIDTGNTETNRALDRKADDAISAVLDFQSKHRSTVFRESSYFDALEQSFSFMAYDVETQLGSSTSTPQVIRISQTPTTGTTAGAPAGTPAAPTTATTGISPAQQAAAQHVIERERLGRSFVERARFGEVAGEVDKSIGNVNKALNRGFMERTDSLKKGLTPQQELDKALESARTSVSEARGKIASLKKTTDQGGNLTRRELRRMSSVLEPFDKRLEEIEHMLKRGPGKSPAAQRDYLNRLTRLTESTINHRGVANGDIFRPGFKGQILLMLQKDLLTGEDGRLVQEYFGRNGAGAVPKMRALVARMHSDREREAYREIFDAIEKDGSFSRLYIWSKIKTMLVGYTPAYYVEQFLKRVSYFGLVIDDDIINATPRGFLPRYINRAIKKGKGFRNNFSISYRNGAGELVKQKFFGGKHFEAFTDVESLIALLESKNSLHVLEDLLKLDKLDELVDALRKLGIEKPEEFAQKFLKFKAWLNSSHKSLTKDSTGLLNFLSALHKYNSDVNLNGMVITKQYIGLLQRTGVALNRLQSAVMNTGIGKIASKFFSIKTAVVEALSAALSTAVPVLAPFERIIAFALRKVLDVAEKIGKTVFKGIIQADMNVLVEMLEEAALSFLKIAKITAVTIMIPLTLIFFITAAVVTSIPQDNPGKMVGAGGGDPCLYGEADCGEGIGTGGTGALPARENRGDPDDCPLSGTVYLTCRSFDNNTGCHGTNAYWGGGQPARCYRMPYYVGNAAPPNMPLSQYSTVCNDGIAPDGDLAGADYGYAADFSSADRNVYVPGFPEDGPWMITGRGDSGAGWWFRLERPGYVLAILHLTPNADLLGTLPIEVEPNTWLGEMWNHPNGIHIHTELMINGVTVKPEDYICL